MIERAVKALELAQGNAPFYVMPAKFKNKFNILKMTLPGCQDIYIFENISSATAEDLCEKLNNQWIVRKIIESLLLTSDKVNTVQLPDKFIQGETVEHQQERNIATFQHMLGAILSGE